MAGGRSSRFGSDKARALVDGVPMLLRIAGELSPVAARITVVAGTAGKYDDLGLRTIADRHPGLGPLAGLHASILDAPPAPWLLLASCDLIAVRRGWIDTLMAAQHPEARAVAFRHDRWEPLLALYSTALLDEVTGRLERGELAMQRLLDSVQATALPLPADWPALCHVNTPAELAEYAGRIVKTKEAAVAEDTDLTKLPATFKAFTAKFPALAAAHESIGKAVDVVGPLDRKTCELIKIGLSVGAGLETATRSHVRRAIEHGATEAEIEQAILLAMNTCGFPRTVMAWQWARRQIERQEKDSD
jgi:molybdopterin-guanine dinucleotide biosynthesis protein A/alkylhydroperoxidase/carboxymuconolactone decarboxylase family protein YurZ